MYTCYNINESITPFNDATVTEKFDLSILHFFMETTEGTHGILTALIGL